MCCVGNRTQGIGCDPIRVCVWGSRPAPWVPLHLLAGECCKTRCVLPYYLCRSGDVCLLPNPEPFCTGVEPALRLSSPQDPPSVHGGRTLPLLALLQSVAERGPETPSGDLEVVLGRGLHPSECTQGCRGLDFPAAEERRGGSVPVDGGLCESRDPTSFLPCSPKTSPFAL